MGKECRESPGGKKEQTRKELSELSCVTSSPWGESVDNKENPLLLVDVVCGYVMCRYRDSWRQENKNKTRERNKSGKNTTCRV